MENARCARLIDFNMEKTGGPDKFMLDDMTVLTRVRHRTDRDDGRTTELTVYITDADGDLLVMSTAFLPDGATEYVLDFAVPGKKRYVVDMIHDDLYGRLKALGVPMTETETSVRFRTSHTVHSILKHAFDAAPTYPMPVELKCPGFVDEYEFFELPLKTMRSL